MMALIKKLRKEKDEESEMWKMMKSPFFHCYKSSLRNEHLETFDELILNHLDGLNTNFKAYEDLFEYFGHVDYFLSEQVCDKLKGKIQQNFGKDKIFKATIDRK